MVNWREWDQSDASWDAIVSGIRGASSFQTSAWARHKADFGWRPVRLICDQDGSPIAALQALMKCAPGGVRVLWARGGPIGEASAWNSDLRVALTRAARGMFVYVRVCPYRKLDEVFQRSLVGAGWSRSSRPLDVNRTLLLDLRPESEIIKEGLSANWRHNLKRGLSRTAVIDWPEADPEVMESIYREMENMKSLPPQHSANELASLHRALGAQLVLKRAVVGEKTVAFRAAAIFSETAVDLLAATSREARKVYASHALLWSLILEARRRGAKTYDLGGFDPDEARGVADFKGGLGALAIETAGEWDFSSPPGLRGLAGSMIAWKLGKSR